MRELMARRKLAKNRDLEKYVKRSARGYLTFLHPKMKEAGVKAVSFGKDVEAANRCALEFELLLKGGNQDSRAKAIFSAYSKTKTLGEVIELFKIHYIPMRNWSAGHTGNIMAKLNKISRLRGKLDFASLAVTDVKDIMFSLFRGNGVGHAKIVFDHLYRYAIGEGFCGTVNLGKLVNVPGQSKRKRDRVKDMAEYHDMRGKCPDWMQDAMDIALIIMQRRSDLVALKVRENIVKTEEGEALRLVTQKTGHAIEIPITDNLKPVIQRCRERALKLGCPFLICARQKISVRTRKAKEHPFQVLPGYLTKEYQKHTGSAFHELRSLSEREYERMGWSPEDIRKLGTWKDDKTRKLYGESDLIEYVTAMSGLVIGRK